MDLNKEGEERPMDKEAKQVDEEAVLFKKRREEEIESRESEEYLNRLRMLIKEDKKANEIKHAVLNERLHREMIAMQNQTKNLIPLVGGASSRAEGVQASATIQASTNAITVKLLLDKSPLILSLDQDLLIKELREIIREKYSLKRFRMYVVSKGEIANEPEGATLRSENIANMDLVRIVRV